VLICLFVAFSVVPQNGAIPVWRFAMCAGKLEMDSYDFVPLFALSRYSTCMGEDRCYALFPVMISRPVTDPCGVRTYLLARHPDRWFNH